MKNYRAVAIRKPEAIWGLYAAENIKHTLWRGARKKQVNDECNEQKEGLSEVAFIFCAWKGAFCIFLLNKKQREQDAKDKTLEACSEALRNEMRKYSC